MNKIKILIAEDMKATAKIYDKALSDQFFEKKFAADGAEALKLYQQWQPNIIVLDMMMPLITGYTVLKSIRNGKSFSDTETTIIMATSNKTVDDIQNCAAYGIQGYIIKPLQLKRLESQILDYYAVKEPELVNRIKHLKTQPKDV